MKKLLTASPHRFLSLPYKATVLDVAKSTTIRKGLPYAMVLFAALVLSSCAVIRPSEVGIKQRLGKLSENVATQGTLLYNPFTSKVVKTSI